jgi:hypothetical protein
VLWKPGERVPSFHQVSPHRSPTSRKSPLTVQDPRVPLGPRFPPAAEFDPLRPLPPTPNVQNFYSPQRFSARPGDLDPALQAKRRMAAQRERDLRNYHQEQQYQKRT